MNDQIGKISRLIGDPIRMTILWSLLDGRAYTATELSIVTDTSAQNMSMHLSKLVQAKLIAVEKQGRHKYYRLYDQDVAYAVEAMTNLIPAKKQKQDPVGEKYPDIQYCRTCYDHLAGKIGVMVTENLISGGFLVLENKTYSVTKKGEQFFQGLGISVDELQKLRRSFAKPCLDWSERKYHLAGSLGAALLDRMIDMDWLRREKDSRVMILTSTGRKELYEKLNVG